LAKCDNFLVDLDQFRYIQLLALARFSRFEQVSRLELVIGQNALLLSLLDEGAGHWSSFTEVTDVLGWARRRRDVFKSAHLLFQRTRFQGNAGVVTEHLFIGGACLQKRLFAALLQRAGAKDLHRGE